MPRFVRRDFVRSLGLGAGAGLLTPLLRSLIAEAADKPARRLVLFTTGNGWGHQGMPRDSMTATGTLATAARSETDWELPAVLQPLAPFKGSLMIAGPFSNPYGGNQHGSGNATLSVMPTLDKGRVGGISIDRYIGTKAFAGDAHASVVVATSEFGRLEGTAVHTSADGPEMPVAAPNTPVRAFMRYLGGLSPGAPGGGEVDFARLAAQDRSILDAMVADVQRARGRLAGPERRKMDQLVESARTLERQLQARQAPTVSIGKGPVAPDPALNKSGFGTAVLRGMVDVTFQALAFGVSHVAHYSFMGRDAYNDSWSSIGVPGDAHENIMHGKAPGNAPPDFNFTTAVQKIITFQAGEAAHLLGSLKAVPEGGGTMLDNTLFAWVNSGGGKHHDGRSTIPVVTVGNAGGGYAPAGKYLRVGNRCISDAFVSFARAMGVDTMTFGDPKVCKGPFA